MALNKMLEQVYGQCLEQRNSTTEKDCTICEQIALDLAKKYGWSQNPDNGLWEHGISTTVPPELADHARSVEPTAPIPGEPLRYGDTPVSIPAFIPVSVPVKQLSSQYAFDVAVEIHRQFKHIGWDALHEKLRKEGYTEKDADRICGAIAARKG